MPKTVVRQVMPADFHAIDFITREAFWDKYQPGCDEHYLVHRIHEKSIAAPQLDLAAEMDGEIIGNVICVPAAVTTAGGIYHDVLCLGPLTVAPAWQLKGIGSLLMESAVKKARELGWRAIFLTGDPTYYHRFGYRCTREFSITFADGSAPDVLMCLELYNGALAGIHGVYEDPPLYGDLPPKEVSAFDKQFPPRERHIYPTQISEWKEW